MPTPAAWIQLVALRDERDQLRFVYQTSTLQGVSFGGFCICLKIFSRISKTQLKIFFF